MAAFYRRMRALFFGAALLATAAGRAAAAADHDGGAAAGEKHGGDKKCAALASDCDFLAGAGAKTCAALEDGCNFVPQPQLTQKLALANFELTTDGQAAVTSCVATTSRPDGTFSSCTFDAATATVQLQLVCPSGYNAVAPGCFTGEDQNQYAPQTALNNLGPFTYCAMVRVGSRFCFVVLRPRASFAGHARRALTKTLPFFFAADPQPHTKTAPVARREPDVQVCRQRPLHPGLHGVPPHHQQQGGQRQGVCGRARGGGGARGARRRRRRQAVEEEEEE